MYVCVGLNQKRAKYMDDKIERKKCFFGGVGLGCGCVFMHFFFLQFLNLVTADGRVSSGDLFPSVSLRLK